ncbi:MAG: DUF523 domain-containing protein [Clostridiaceae bacterium]|nr:DUF523 domain-containing protein [Clostridiaceae bacterium]
MKVLVSACILGENCKYNGKNNYNQKITEFLEDKEVITICPEMLAGLGTPRKCAEIVDGRVMDNEGNDVDQAFRKGVEIAVSQVKTEAVDLAVLQARSPTCGVNQVYDGSFSGALIKGEGLFAKELLRMGIKVLDSSDFK